VTFSLASYFKSFLRASPLWFRESWQGNEGGANVGLSQHRPFVKRFATPVGLRRLEVRGVRHVRSLEGLGGRDCCGLVRAVS